MTDNEKAATFIGWREGQPCSHREQIDGSQWGNGIQQCFLVTAGCQSTAVSILIPRRRWPILATT